MRGTKKELEARIKELEAELLEALETITKLKQREASKEWCKQVKARRCRETGAYW